MGCFSLAWLEQFFVWVVIVIAVVSLIRLLVPYLLGLIGIPLIGAAINIILWAFVAIMCIHIIFMLFGCLLGGGGGGILHFPSR